MSKIFCLPFLYLIIALRSSHVVAHSKNSFFFFGDVYVPIFSQFICWVVCFLVKRVGQFFAYFQYKSFTRCVICKDLLPICGSSFHSLNSVTILLEMYFYDVMRWTHSFSVPTDMSYLVPENFYDTCKKIKLINMIRFHSFQLIIHNTLHGVTYNTFKPTTSHWVMCSAL